MYSTFLISRGGRSGENWRFSTNDIEKHDWCIENYTELTLFSKVSWYGYLMVSSFYICFKFPIVSYICDNFGCKHYCIDLFTYSIFSVFESIIYFLDHWTYHVWYFVFWRIFWIFISYFDEALFWRPVAAPLIAPLASPMAALMGDPIMAALEAGQLILKLSEKPNKQFLSGGFFGSVADAHARCRPLRRRLCNPLYSKLHSQPYDPLPTLSIWFPADEFSICSDSQSSQFWG